MTPPRSGCHPRPASWTPPPAGSSPRGRGGRPAWCCRRDRPPDDAAELDDRVVGVVEQIRRGGLGESVHPTTLSTPGRTRRGHPSRRNRAFPRSHLSSSLICAGAVTGTGPARRYPHAPVPVSCRRSRRSRWPRRCSAPPPPPRPPWTPVTRVSATTVVGMHNAYERGTYTYLAQALDARPGLIELDVWPDIITRQWRVSHSNPLGNDNNCVAATTPAAALHRHPQQEPGALPGRHPALVRRPPRRRPAHAQAGAEDRLQQPYRAGAGRSSTRCSPPGSAAGCSAPPTCAAGTPTLDAAARATPGRPGAARRQGDRGADPRHRRGGQPDRHPVDRHRVRPHLARPGGRRHPRSGAGVPGRAPGPVRRPAHPVRRHHLRPWFVVFDGDATAYVTGGIDTSWYDTNHYLLVMTDAQNVPPAVGNTAPTAARGPGRPARRRPRQRRLRRLGGDAFRGRRGPPPGLTDPPRPPRTGRRCSQCRRCSGIPARGIPLHRHP